MKTLLVTQKLKLDEQVAISNRLGSFYKVVFPEEYSTDVLKQHAEGAQVCFGSKFNDDLLRAAKNLEVIQAVSTGVDKFNLQELLSRKITLCNTRSHSIYVAEFAIALMFSLIKKIHLHDRMMRGGTWWRPTGDPTDSFYLSDTIINRKIGFIGFGNVGQHIAKMLIGFEVKILAFSTSERLSLSGLDGVEFTTKNAVIEGSDIIFVTLPLTDMTRNSIAQESFTRASARSIWINISRGSVLNEEELYSALKQRKIAGIALDNWFDSEEITVDKKYPSRLPFHEMENVLLSPYRAIYLDGMSPHIEGAITNLENFAKWGNLSNIIDLEKGY